MSRTPIDKVEAGQILNEARLTKGLTWRELADYIDKPLVWTVAALLGKHPVPIECAEAVGERLSLDVDVRLPLHPFVTTTTFRRRFQCRILGL